MIKIIYSHEHRARKKIKKWFRKIFFQVNAVFGKTMENVRKHRDIKLVPVEVTKNYLVSEPNYYTTNLFLKITNADA